MSFHSSMTASSPGPCSVVSVRFLEEMSSVLHLYPEHLFVTFCPNRSSSCSRWPAQVLSALTSACESGFLKTAGTLPEGFFLFLSFPPFLLFFLSFSLSLSFFLFFVPLGYSFWQPTLIFLPEEFQGQRSLVGYSPWGHRVGHN